MSSDIPDSTDASLDDLAPRTRRAQTERMDIHLVRAGGLYGVTTESGAYQVDVGAGECTCPDWQEREPMGGCKHLRRVDMEIRAGTVPGPDGRLPRTAVTDGGPDVARNGASSAREPTLSGPHYEVDKHGRPTGTTYYRCEQCGREALERRDLRHLGCPKHCE